jgi:hypothetical protein
MTASAPATKYFTLEDANRTLPLVRMVVRDIVELFSDVQRRRERLEGLLSRSRRKARRDDPYTEEVRQMESELESDEQRLRGYLEELAGIGAELKDPVTGLIDFPAFVEGREVCLCWKLGEEEIAHWHEMDTGFAGRQPVATLPEADLFDVNSAEAN